MTNRSPSSILAIDKYTNRIQSPTLLLETRRGSVIGAIDYTNWNISLVANGIDEITFDVHRPTDITDDMTDYQKMILTEKHKVWNNLSDLKIVEIKDFARFQISVSYTDNTETIKSVHGQSLEVELGQLYLYEFHINDDDDMESDDYKETYFYNEDDVEHSLLHKILADKAPHWKLRNITPYVAMSEDRQPELSKKFLREYTVDGETIYDFLTGTVAVETNVVFIFDTINRAIDCYSLCDCINQETGNVICSAIGEDTTVFVSKNKLANEISIEGNSDNIKNCFRVEGGDDIITDMIRVANATGSNYIYRYSDFMKEDMSEGLSTAIDNYLNLIEENKEEYNKIYLDLCKQYNLKYYFESSMMPGVTINKNTGEIEDNSIKKDAKPAEEEYQSMMNAINGMFVAVKVKYSEGSFDAVTKSVLAMVQTFVDSRYEVEVVGTPTFKVTNDPQEETNTDKWEAEWTGKFRIKRTSDENDYYPIGKIDDITSVTILVNRDEMAYAEQRIRKSLSQGDFLDLDFEFDKSEYMNGDYINMDAVYDYFEYAETTTSYENGYSLARLKGILTGYEECVSILANMGQEVPAEGEAPSDEYKFYRKYLDIRNVLGGYENSDGKIVVGLVDKRQSDVDNVNFQIEELSKSQKAISDRLNLEANLGEFYEEFCMYRREDTYTNSNYISDGLSDAECIEKAKELLSVAEEELNKACVLQRTVSTSLNNLFTLPEFEPLYDSFALYNYIRLQTADEILKLRLIGIDYNGESTADINVTFSEQIESVDGTINDLKSILDQAASIATTFPATARQAQQGSEAKSSFNELYNSGLNTAYMLIKNSDNNEVTFGPYGLLCKAMGDEGNYGQKQLRIIGNGMYLTDDAWQTVRMALGQIELNGNEYYGIIAEALVGKLIAGEQMTIGNENGSVIINGEGITITNGTIKWSKDGSDGIKAPAATDIEGLDTAIEDSLNEYKKEITDFQNNVNEQLSTLNAAIPTTEIGEDYIISPKIGGGYLYIKDTTGTTGTSVEINPVGTTFDGHNSDYVFNVTDKDNNVVMGVTNDGDGYFSGTIHADYIEANTGGSIGGWNINSTSLSYGDLESNDYMILDAKNKCIISKSGIDINGNANKATFASGALKFYKNEKAYTKLNITRWNDKPSEYGLGLNSEMNSKFISFGDINQENKNSYKTHFLLNYGLNPYRLDADGNATATELTQGIICYSDILLEGGALYFDNDCYFNDTYYITNESYQGIRCNGYFSTTGGLLVGDKYIGNPGDYMLNVTGDSYIKGNLYADNIGAYNYTSGTASSPTSGNYSNVCNFTLDAGVYVITTRATFAASSTGRRRISIYANSIDYGTLVVPAIATDRSDHIISTSTILSLSESTVVYSRAWQNGDVAYIDAFMQAVRIR